MVWWCGGLSGLGISMHATSFVVERFVEGHVAQGRGWQVEGQWSRPDRQNLPPYMLHPAVQRSQIDDVAARHRASARTVSGCSACTARRGSSARHGPCSGRSYERIDLFFK